MLRFKVVNKINWYSLDTDARYNTFTAPFRLEFYLYENRIERWLSIHIDKIFMFFIVYYQTVKMIVTHKSNLVIKIRYIIFLRYKYAICTIYINYNTIQMSFLYIHFVRTEREYENVSSL